MLFLDCFLTGFIIGVIGTSVVVGVQALRAPSEVPKYFIIMDLKQEPDLEPRPFLVQVNHRPEKRLTILDDLAPESYTSLKIVTPINNYSASWKLKKFMPKGDVKPYWDTIKINGQFYEKKLFNITDSDVEYFLLMPCVACNKYDCNGKLVIDPELTVDYFSPTDIDLTDYARLKEQIQTRQKDQAAHLLAEKVKLPAFDSVSDSFFGLDSFTLIVGLVGISSLTIVILILKRLKRR